MSELTRYQIEKITDEIGKQVEVLMDKISDSPEEHEAKIKKENKNVRIKKAKKLGLNPLKNLEEQIRTRLNEKIIYEIKANKLKHREVAEIIQSSRPNVTAVMNRRIKGFSTDYLLKMSAMIGIYIELEF
jgi:predicted XRE-type DNA-binding protein